MHDRGVTTSNSTSYTYTFEFEIDIFVKAISADGIEMCALRDIFYEFSFVSIGTETFFEWLGYQKLWSDE